MSLDLQVFTKSLSDDLVPKIVKRLNDFDMVVEVHPDFFFSNQSGFLPFKFSFKTTPFKSLKGKELMSGFEMFIDDFSLQARKDELNPKKGFLGKLLTKKEPEVLFAPLEFEQRLKDCTKEVTFVWRAGNSFELRFASLTSAILTELTGGVCCYPADDIWYDDANIVQNAFDEAVQYEQSLAEEKLRYHEFDGWH